MASQKKRPHLVFADKNGSIYDHPHLLMLCRRGRELALPRPDELIPLPDESEFFLLPERSAVGLDPDTGHAEGLQDYAVAAFVSPGYTVTASAAYVTMHDAPMLPIFSYAAIGFLDGRFYVCAKRVDQDTRQVFADIPTSKIRGGAHRLLKEFPENRLIRHLTHCALTYSCPAARNLALGRYEAPLPTARTCNARCVGCLSKQPEDSGFPAVQDRIDFTPSAEEICQVMRAHAAREKKRPIYSFGQGCEGEPMTEAETIAEAVSMFRKEGGQGTVNMNTNASLPATIPTLAKAGLSSIRVSLNSAREELYNAYYRPKGFAFKDVVESIMRAKQAGMHVSLNLLYFPGVTDSEDEMEALSGLIKESRLDFIQLRNLNLDPELYLQVASCVPESPAPGFNLFRKRLKKAFPWLGFGYFNPYLG